VSARTKARKRALDVLYSADLRDIPVLTVLNTEAERAPNEPQREASWRYAQQIVIGVVDHQAEIDELIETHAHEWTLTRMPALDRAILRIGVWEIIFNDDIPLGVGISEAVEAATIFSTDDSAGFVNGVLAAIATTKL